MSHFHLVNTCLISEINSNLLINSYIDYDGVPRVADELPLGHLVLDVRRGEVDGEQDQREAHHVNRI